MAARLFIKLTEDETDALCRLADRELRQPGDQVRALLRKALAERGLLELEQAELAEPEATPCPG